MKRIITIFSLLFCVSCSGLYWQYNDYYDFKNFKCSIPELENKLLPENKLEKNLEIIITWIKDNITYERDKVQRFELPEIVLELKKGDCKDMTGLMVALSYFYLHVNMDIVWVTEHLVPIYKGVCYDAVKITYNERNPNETHCDIMPLDQYLSFTNVTLNKIIPFENIPKLINYYNESTSQYSKPGPLI